MNRTQRAWIDITRPLREGMPVWPGDPEFRLTRFCAMAQGEIANVSAVSMSLHTGTHVDAPLHYLAEGDSLDALPVDALMGWARVLNFGQGRPIRATDLESAGIRSGERILLKTAVEDALEEIDPQEGGFRADLAAVAPDAARYLAASSVRAVGIDALSIGPFGGEGDETHRILLGAGIWVMEGLDLRGVPAGEYELICLPLRVAGADGAPARALLRPLSGG
jgi:arylformamidase